MDGAIMGMVGVVIAMIGGTLGLVSRMYKTTKEMNERLTEIERIIKEG